MPATVLPAVRSSSVQGSAAGSGVQISGNAKRITASVLSAIWDIPNGQLIVDAGDKDDVQLVLTVSI